MEILVEMAIDLACQLQEDERYLALREAQCQADADESLQELIGEFNMKRLAINEEEVKASDTRDSEKLRTLNEDLGTIYDNIMKNEHMIAYNEKKTELDSLVQKINAAIAIAVQGGDPHMAAVEGGCSGNCGSCGGCH